MLRHELTTSTIRFYEAASDDPFCSYDAICTLVWESPKTVWVKGFNGTVSRPLLREFIVFLDSQGVELIKAFRAPGRTLPFIRVRTGDYVEVLVADVMLYVNR